jgi:hypothetical protein
MDGLISNSNNTVEQQFSNAMQSIDNGVNLLEDLKEPHNRDVVERINALLGRSSNFASSFEDLLYMRIILEGKVDPPRIFNLLNLLMPDSFKEASGVVTRKQRIYCLL